MSTILDQTEDASRQSLVLFSTRYDFPDYVKQAEAAAVLDKPAHMSSVVFGDTRRRQFPCHTKAACWLSYVYFLEHRNQLDAKSAGEIESRLEKFARQYAITDDIAAMRQRHQEKLAEPQLRDQDYMLVWSGDNGVKTREYPLRNPQEVKQASAWFSQHRDNFTFQDRRVMAERLLKRADDYGVALPAQEERLLQQQICHGTCDPKTAAEHVRNRAVLATHKLAQFRDPLNHLADMLESNPQAALCPATLASFCDAVSQFDEQIKLAGHYTSMLPRPEDIFCQITIKEAEEAISGTVPLVTGNMYSKEDVAKLAYNDIREVLGDELAEAMSTGLAVDADKLADVAPTLPRGDAVLFDRLLAERQIRPFGKTAAAVAGPSFAEWDSLARA
jgi:hypothetical protein